MNFEKGLYPVMILLILEQYADEENPISTNKLRGLMKQQYGHYPWRNTISSNIEKLRYIGVDIACVKDHENRYYIRNRKLTFGEVTSLCDMVHSSFFISNKESDALIKKLLGFLSLRQQKLYREQIHDENRKKDPNSKDFFENYQLLKSATNFHLSIEAVYHTKPTLLNNVVKFVRKKHIIFPIRLAFNDGFGYLVGVIQGKEQEAHFRIDRFDSIKFSDIPFPANLKKSSYELPSHTGPYMISGPNVAATFLCEMDVLNAIIDRVGYDARFLNHPQNPNEFYLIVNAPEEAILRMAQQYMDRVTLIEPEYLREIYIERCKASLQKTEEAQPFHTNSQTI